MPLVVKLNSRLPVIAVMVMIATMRTITDRGSSTTLEVRLDGGSVSRGATMAKTTPAPIDSRPGSANASRQPKYLTRNPVTRAAIAMPRLPASPLKPMVMPGFLAPWTSIGMPTG